MVTQAVIIGTVLSLCFSIPHVFAAQLVSFVPQGTSCPSRYAPTASNVRFEDVLQFTFVPADQLAAASAPREQRVILFTGSATSGSTSSSVCDPTFSSQETGDGGTAEVLKAATQNPDWVHPILDFPPNGGFQVGSMIGPHIQVVRFPLFGILPFPFESMLSIDPILVHENSQKQIPRPGEDPGISRTGFGDLSLRHRIRYGDENTLALGVTTLGVKLPTGDQEQFVNGVEQLPTGTGSVDLIFNQAFSVRRGPIRLMISLGYLFNTTGAYSETFIDNRPARFRQKIGDAFTGMGGAEYFTPIQGLSVYAKLLGLVKQRSKRNWSHLDDGSTILNEKLADSLKTIDVGLGIVYSVRVPFRGKPIDIGLRMGVLIPAVTDFDRDAIHTQSRSIIYDVGVGGAF